MAEPIDPIALAQALIRCPSVTPASGEVFDILEAALTPLGFTAHARDPQTHVSGAPHDKINARAISFILPRTGSNRHLSD